MKRLSLLIILSLVAVVLVVGSPVSALYIDTFTIFNPGTKEVYKDFPGEASLTTLTNKAATLSNHGKFEEALLAINKAITVDPTVARPYYNKGMILYNLGRYEEAIKAFDWGIKIDPKAKDAKYRELAVNKTTASNLTN